MSSLRDEDPILSNLAEVASALELHPPFRCAGDGSRFAAADAK